MARTRLTLIAPVFNEEEVIGRFHARARGVLDALPDVDGEILFVVDRCTDDTVGVLRQLIAGDPRARALVLSSRFGHQMSLLAGIERAQDADVVVMMDSDLQHPPELIPELLDRWRQGHDVVYTVRRDTEDASALRKAAGNLFYRMLSRLSQVPINANAADFRLISGRVARVLATQFHERNMFLRGLFSWMGFRQTGVEYTAAARAAGRSKYSLARMVQLATHGVLAFSTKPLQVGIFVGVGFAALAFAYTVALVVNWFIDRSVPSGWTSLIVLLLLFSGIQLIVLGVMGAYIGGIYEEVKGRPHYLVDEEIGGRAAAEPGERP